MLKRLSKQLKHASESPEPRELSEIIFYCL